MTKVFCTFYTLTFGGALYLALLPSTVVSQDDRKPAAAVPAIQESLKTFLRRFADDKTTRYVAAFERS